MPLSNSIRTRLQYQHETIKDLVGALTEEQLKHRTRPDKWSAFENIVHLAAYQPTFIDRIQLMQQEDGPHFNRYVADNDPLFHAYLQKSLPELTADIAAKRLVIIDNLEGAGDTALKRIGHHPKFGALPLWLWAEFFLLHEAHHLFTAFTLTQELRAL